MHRVRFVLVGGFLGAGKTTLIGELARRYVDAGKRIAIVTNDQAAGLVDTANLRSRGFDVGEVAGACFCCSFDDLLQTTDNLAAASTPDVILAEPVGSCTDLVATVIRPLADLHGDRFELAPFGVIVKPSHAFRILDETPHRRGFSRDAEYIFHKQLEEADYLILGRGDQISDEDERRLRDQLAQWAPGVPVVRASPATGRGVEEVLGYIESPMAAGRRVLDIDYDVYAAGEAEMGWVNATATIGPDEPAGIDVAQFTERLLGEIAVMIDGEPDAAIAHLKAVVEPIESSTDLGDQPTIAPHRDRVDGRVAVASVVDNAHPLDWSRKPTASSSVPMRCVINARVAIDPQTLELFCLSALRRVAALHNATLQIDDVRNLRPGRPEPVHRYADN